MTVWILIIVLNGYDSGRGYSRAPIIIDNLATGADCQATAKAVKATLSKYEGDGQFGKATCLAVRKVKP